MRTAGYSKTPLSKKLGFKEGFVVRLINPPAYYNDLFEYLPSDIVYQEKTHELNDLIHYFETDAKLMTQTLKQLKNEIKQNGMIWVSWPKKASKVATDIIEDTIRNYALTIGLVDIKVCAVDDIWSGLKLVIPVKNRK